MSSLYETDVEWRGSVLNCETMVSLFVGTDFIFGESRFYSLAFIYNKIGLNGFGDIDDWELNERGVFSKTISRSMANAIESGHVSKEWDIENGRKRHPRYVLQDKGKKLLYEIVNDNDALLNKRFTKMVYIKYLIGFQNWRLIALIASILFKYDGNGNLETIAYKMKNLLNTKYNVVHDKDIEKAKIIINMLTLNKDLCLV